MSDTFPGEHQPAPRAGEPPTDFASRLAELVDRPSEPGTRPPGLLFGRRPDGGAAPEPTREPDAAPPEPSSPPTSARPAAAGGPIGRLVRVSASDLWSDGHEVARWIAGAPDQLAETIGAAPLSLVPPDTNVVAGSDVTGAPASVICEVGPTTDEALGALLRVAALQEGGTVTWVAGEARDIHVAAVSWLNRTTAPRFFLVRVSGIRIDGSASAPLFDLVVRPPRAEPAPGDPLPTDEHPRRRAEDHLPAD